jgi:hypothetical protein
MIDATHGSTPPGAGERPRLYSGCRLPIAPVNYGKNFEPEPQKTFKEHGMKSKPGRKSTAELSVKITALEVRRPDPPDELSSEEKETWVAVAATKPPDWWRFDTFPLLTAYCSHIENARRLDRLLIAVRTDEYMKDALDFTSYLNCLDRLLRARDRESRALVNLARSMRISQQAMILPRGAGRQTANAATTRLPHETGPPWEYSNE